MSDRVTVDCLAAVEVPVERMIANESLDTYSSSLRRSLVDVNSHKVGLGLVLRVNNDGEIVIKDLIHGYAAQRQGGVSAGTERLERC